MHISEIQEAGSRNIRIEGMRIMAFLTAVLSFFSMFGCKQKDAFPFDPSAVPESLAFSCSSMSMSDSYSFVLYKENGRILFDAEYFSYDRNEVIHFENKEASDSDMEKMLDIIAQYDLINFIRTYKEPKIEWEVLDGTDYYLSIRMSDDSQRSIKMCDGSPTNVGFAGNARKALYDFFSELAIQMADNNGSEI